MEVLPIVFLLIGLVLYLMWRTHKRTIETWRRVAANLGLHVEVRSGFSRPIISGNLHGLPVRIDTYTQSHGKSSTTYTRYQVRYPSVGFDVQLKREGGLSLIGKIFGIEDVQVGDPAFDGAFKIKTSDQSRLVALLTPSVRSGLFRLLASYRNAVISEDHIGTTRAKYETDPKIITSTIQRLVATAKLLTSPSAGVSDVDVTDRVQGLLTEVADRVRQAVQQHPEDVDQRIFEVETLAAAGRDQQAADRIEELERLAPADPDVLGWKEALKSPVKGTPGTEVAVNEMAENLFGGNDLSFETRTKFNAEYAGAQASWEGRVKNVRVSRQNATVTITVATVNNDLYGNTDIDVVVETAASDAPEIDATVTVSGVLATIDPLLRNIYMENVAIS